MISIKKKLENYQFVAAIFLVIQLIIILRDYLMGSIHYQIFWFCNFAPLLFAIGFYYKDNDFIKAIIDVGLIGQVVALFLFSFLIYNGNVPFNDIPSDIGKVIFIITTTLIHLVAVFALFISYHIKPTRKALYYSFLIIMVMFVSVILFTNPHRQINLVYSSGKIIDINFPFYTPLWPVLFFILLVIPSHWIQTKLYEKANKKI